MKNELQKKIFKKGSKTYFTSSLFFPDSVREEVSILYAFVRTADDMVDELPQRGEEFYSFCEKWRTALQKGGCNDPIIAPFIDLSLKRSFDFEWVESFFRSMEWDLEGHNYDTVDETVRYIYGSAEVIGLFMARIMGLDEESFGFARMLGRSMQYINFIRDIDEDNRLGRCYLPLSGSGLDSLAEVEVSEKRNIFETFVRKEIERYFEWQAEAEKGFKYIPKRYRIPIKTASDMYKWTAGQIRQDPMIVFRKKVKPRKIRIFGSIAGNFLAERS